MRYLSTRGKAPEQRFLGILLSGLASDGGLYLPAYYPQVSHAERAAWRALDYAALASAILHKFIDDIPAADIDALCRRTYTAQVYCNARDPADATSIAALRWLEPGLALLELSNGPTLAFKDMAMQLLGQLFEYALAKEERYLNVLGATSGDTGSAAEYALRGRRGVNVFMLSPLARMSAFQRAQMYSLVDANIFNLAIEGTFDDCQDIVKQLAGDLEFKQRLRLGAVNSINGARVVAQVVDVASKIDRCDEVKGRSIVDVQLPFRAGHKQLVRRRRIHYTLRRGNCANSVHNLLRREVQHFFCVVAQRRNEQPVTGVE